LAAKFFIFFRKALVVFFVSLFFRPGRLFFRFVFHKILVKSYKHYFSLIKKLGWGEFRNNPLVFLLGQKLVHIAVAAIAVIVVFSNLAYKGRAASVDDAANQTILASLITSEFGTDEENRLIEEFFDQEDEISPLQESYLNSLYAERVEPMVSPDENGQAGQEDGEEFVSEEPVLRNPWIAETKKTKRDRTETVYYAVESGDTVSSIAEKFDVTINTVLWENKLTAYSVLHPGDALAILPTSGINHEVAKGENLEKIASAFSVDKEKIAEANRISLEAGLKLGQKLFIPGGRQLAMFDRQPENYSGLRILKDLIKPKAGGQAGGAFDSDKKAPSSASPVKGGKMNWPTSGYRTTQYYTWRHHAVDIADKVGTPLYAAEAGIIEEIGWGRGYGNQIVINHGGGRKTRYAHLSKFYVKKGERVGKGQTIGGMGSTGWSTGPHLHFEVIINGAKYNPLNYIR